MNKNAQTTALADFISEVRRLNADTHEAEDRQIYGRYLSEAATILAKVIRDEPIGDDVASMDRLFGNTWLKDDQAYRQAYTAWDRYKGLLIQSIQGMTVNERLFSLGLLDEFDSAASQGDESHLRAILCKCFLGEDNIQKIIDTHLKTK